MTRNLLKMAAVLAVTASCGGLAQDWSVGVGANYRNLSGGLHLRNYSFKARRTVIMSMASILLSAWLTSTASLLPLIR